MLELIILVGLLAAFSYILCEKWGFLDYVHQNVQIKVIKKMLECEFCTLFWICVLISIIFGLFHPEAYYVAPFSVIIARFVL